MTPFYQRAVKQAHAGAMQWCDNVACHDMFRAFPMALRFPSAWRFKPPPDGNFINSAMPGGAVSDFTDLIEKIRTERSRQSILEFFKSAFGSRSTSSSESWAYSDLMTTMEGAADNAPLFIENMYDACEELKQECPEWFVPDVSLLNEILARHNVGYEIRPPELVARELGGIPIPVAVPSPSFAERATETLNSSLGRSEQLLGEGRPREAVQEVLWLLETIATAFRGIGTQSGQIEGKYFNRIVADLRNKHLGTTLERVLEWITTMHGYLSSPGGGGVRHGTDLARGIDLDLNEARLFCNLTRSYISFLIVEHDSLCRAKDSEP
jgi:hypothetical protein